MSLIPIIAGGRKRGASAPIWHQDDIKESLVSQTDTELIVDKPSNLADGDLVLLFLGFSNITDPSEEIVAITPPTGFALIRDEFGSGGTPVARVIGYCKEAGSSEPASYALSRDGTPSSAFLLVAGRVTGHRSVAGSPIDKNTGDNSGTVGRTELVIPSLTPSEPNTLLVAAIHLRGNTENNAVPSGMTEQWLTSGGGGGSDYPQQPRSHGAIEYCGRDRDKNFHLGHSPTCGGGDVQHFWSMKHESINTTI